MGRISTLAGGRRGATTVSWAVTAGLVAAAAWFVSHGEPDWAGLTLLLVGVVLVPPVLARDPNATFPGELVALTALPAFVRATGAFPQVTPFLAVAGLAVLVAIVLERYTSLSMTPRFAVVFTVGTTMAFAAVWTVGIWVADAAFATDFVGGKTELMWDMVVATGAGIVAGVVFDLYFTYTDRLERLGGRDSSTDRGGDIATDGDTSKTTALDVEVDGYQRLAIRGMQAVLAAIFVFALVRTNWTLVVNSAIPLAITFLPGILRHEYGYPMDARLTLWVTLAVTLHGVGAVGPYQIFGWYDSVTHTLSASLVAVVGYTVARAVELHTDDVSFSPAFRVVFVVLFVLAMGVVWEILEFGSGGLASIVGGEPALAQYGTADIVNDLVFDAVGAVVVAVGSADRFDGLASALTTRVRVLVRGE